MTVRALLRAFTPTGEDGAVIRRNVGWLIGDRVFRLLVALVLNVWMVNYLGPGQLGLLGFAQSLVGILAIVSQLGLETILVRDLVWRPADAPAILGSALGLRIGGAAVTLGLAVTSMALLRPGDGTAQGLALVFGSVYSFMAFDVIESWFQSRTRVKPYVIARAVVFALTSVAKAAALFFHAPLTVLAMAIASEFVFSAGALLIAYRAQPDATHGWRFQAAEARRLLRASWPLMLNSAATLLLIRIDQVMLTQMRGAHENGIYAAAQRLSESLFFIPIAIANAAAPALLRSHRRDRAEYEHRLSRVFFALTAIAVGIALPTSLLAPWVVGTIFRPEYRATAPVLALHVWSLPGLFMGVAITNWFIAEERQPALMLRSVIGAASNIALNLWLIPAWGARGAATATIVAQTLAYWLANAAFPSTRGLFRLQIRSLLPPARRAGPV